MNLRTAEDVIKATRPQDIFSMDKATIEEEKEGYVKLFTPSPYNNDCCQIGRQQHHPPRQPTPRRARRYT